MKFIEENVSLVYGYIFGFIGSAALWHQIGAAVLLGIAGALGGWIFDMTKGKIENYIDSRKKQKDGKN